MELKQLVVHLANKDIPRILQKAKVLFLFSQEPAIDLYSKPDESNPHPPTLFP